MSKFKADYWSSSKGKSFMLISSGIIELIIKSQPINLRIPALQISVKKGEKEQSNLVPLHFSFHF